LNNIEIGIPSSIDGSRIADISKSIGIFTPEDIKCIQELWHEFLVESSDQDRYYFLYAKINGIIQGFICYGHRPLTTGTYDIYWLAVHSTQQKKGVGKMLLSSAEKQIKILGGYQVLIETSGLNIFSNTREFYLSSGYSLTATIADFYDDNDALNIFIKRIN